ncbi:MAG TPA: hypothetical protein VGO58_05510 [Chitinophagaceae bacterium]|jgi:hypothetical protein|nr:hypothetical protein [Chitinophagaceae bacterium]
MLYILRVNEQSSWIAIAGTCTANVEIARANRASVVSKTDSGSTGMTSKNCFDGVKLSAGTGLTNPTYSYCKHGQLESVLCNRLTANVVTKKYLVMPNWILEQEG